MSATEDPSAVGGRPEGQEATPDGAEAVAQFLRALAREDVDGAMRLVAPQIVYENVSLPTLRGRDRVRRVFGVLARTPAGFDVRIHRIAQNGSAVLTERTDVLFLGPFRLQFWVCGVFEVSDGRITLWRDYFDWSNMLRATVRGAVGVLIPRLRPRL
ncbi:limonene-1,2-epoxide hydrolase [Rhodococcus sp. D2-41]|uniref:limonene-1,2-epoxide hydrolase family protein n=1 Tax=Speluncibacter jeojiensis TaxID=2710754 RepID=UPI00241048DB|nr:limonene-1,2-epoxide hydrolase family protein [Rhodococcus sp. D2-41]MDG3012744.1 limonene-1,2-epoxide hydrolase [Rhodococcus sp. D2-41]